MAVRTRQGNRNLKVGRGIFRGQLAAGQTRFLNDWAYDFGGFRENLSNTLVKGVEEAVTTGSMELV